MSIKIPRRGSRCAVEFGDGLKVPVRAETLEGDELESAWERIAVEAPENVKYRTKTYHELPVVRLRRRT